MVRQVDISHDDGRRWQVVARDDIEHSAVDVRCRHDPVGAAV